LSNLDNELRKTPRDEKTAWIYALQECPDLVGDSHKLLFLRCEVFRADLAASRIVKYWQKRKEIFGKEKAFQALTYDNLFKTKNEHTALFSGFWHFVTVNDSGRGILFCDPSLSIQKRVSHKTAIQTVWYVVHAALESESVQKKGIVVLVNGREFSFAHFDKNFATLFISCFKGCLPIRISAFQLCHPPKIFKVIWPFFRLLLGPVLRKRVLITSGSDEDVVKKLGKYGMIRDQIPSKVGGNLDFDIETWAKDRCVLGL